MGLDLFHPLVADWFRGRFAALTPVQESGFAAIAAGRHALLSAPTGSGKTLAAFLWAIDRLLRQAVDGALADRSEVVYVSPLKALSNDVRKNLEIPLAELTALAAARGLALPEIRLALRTGDTPASERQRTARVPPHVWITTPESLYLLLTSDSGRRSLATVHTVIVDEIHAVADDKRGAHLALSLERLEALCGRRLQRVGLSATVRPIEEVARLLVGAGGVAPDGVPDCAIVDSGSRRALDLGLELPQGDLGPIATHETWREVLDRIAALALEQRTTLVFVNTRRLVERVSHQLSERLGEAAVVAHHGSLARKTRLAAEQRLKHGEARVCVATASLELGIDVGTVDLVCQIGSPRSVAVALQRVGRSGHAVGGTPRGRLFPLTRDELCECAALVRLLHRGELDALTFPRWPLDVLAQQVVAAAAPEPWDEERLFALVRRAWPYRDLPRERFDQVIAMLSEGIATGRGRRSALLHRDGVNHTVRGRRGSRITALTSGGAIPDNADYDVVLDPAGTHVGRINEDFAIESLAGDVFLLGNASWRIRRVERGVVRVEDARGAAPTIPFWLGEAPARTPELSRAVGELRGAVDALLPDVAAATRLLEDGYRIGAAAAGQIVAYVVEGKRVLGVVPTAGRIVAERFFDESGGMQLILHAPAGGRINRAWGLALRKRFCRSFDFELQASAGDDGVNLSLGPQHSFPLAEVFSFLTAKGVEEVLTQAVLPSPLFTTRWRWAASRSLALARFERGRKVPAPLTRMRADDLLAAVFPAQAGCQDNAPPGGDLEIPDHPLVFEAMRDCLTEALDVDGLRDLLLRIERGEVEVHARDTAQPSAFSHQILNAMPYAFLDDAPLEERRARAVALRRVLPESALDLSQLDPEAIRAAEEDAWPRPRDADEMHDALLHLVLLPEDALRARFGAEAEGWLATLHAAGRLHREAGFVAATERAAVAALARRGDEAAALAVVRGWSECLGPFHAKELAQTLGLPLPRVEAALAALEAGGALLRGAFTPGAAAPGETEWCDRRILARIHRATIGRLRREIEPVPAAVYLRFLARWQKVASDARGEGLAGLLEAVELLQGFEAPAAAWEASLLPARVGGYEPELSDRACLGGDVVWGRFSRRGAPEAEARRAPLHRAGMVSLALREDLDWLVERGESDGEAGLGSRAKVVLAVLRERGATFFGEIARAAHLLRPELEDALGELVALGLASADGFAPLRRIARSAADRQRIERASRFGRRPLAAPEGEGRWWLLDRSGAGPADAAERRAAQIVRRYGVISRELLAREPAAPPWRDLLPVLRRAEARGELRGGRFLAGLAGEQFALAEAVVALRAVRREEAAGELCVVSATDPMNLAGIITPGPRIAATLANRVALVDGVAAGWIEAGAIGVASGVEPETERRVREALAQANGSSIRTPALAKSR